MFKNLRIRNKLIFIQVITISLSSLIVGFGIYYLQLENVREKKLKETISIARILSYNVLPAMEFFDENVASDVLNTIKDVPEIENVTILQINDKVFAKYVNPTYNNEEITYPEFSNESFEQVFTNKYLFTKFDIIDKEKKLGTIILTSNLNDLQKTKNQFFTILFVGLLCIIIISLLLSLLIQGAITSPIKELLVAVQNIAKTKDYKLRVSKYGNDEIGELTENFNTLIAIVEEQNNILSEDNKKLDNLVQKRTIELKKANDKLEEHLIELEETNNELSKFVYIVSHDLKAPLRAISTLSSFIEEDIGDDVSDEIKENLSLVRKRTHRMQNLIEGLLQYSKSGKSVKNKEDVSLEELYTELRGIFNEDKNYVIHFNVHENKSIHVDRILLQQVLQNLIQNAIKYNDKEVAEITINFDEKDDFYTFDVKDNGVGIDPKFHTQIFEVFKTLQSRDEMESTGIGLSIVKRIVEDNGGTISVQSKEGEGSTFTFTWKK